MSSFCDAWYQNSSVRNKSRVMLDINSDKGFFPVALAPICHHELVCDIPGASDQILLQYAYKYLQEVCITETDVVNPACLNIVYHASPVQLSDELSVDALSIITDEAFHSYVAKDYFNQLAEHSQVKPIILERQNDATEALQKLKAFFPEEYTKVIELVAACISENVFTDEIIRISKFTDVNPSFHQLMRDHARDEGRHAMYFAKVMSCLWEQSSASVREVIVSIIPKYLEYSFDCEHDRQFAFHLLISIGLSNEQTEMVMEESHSQLVIDNQRFRRENVAKFLKRSGLLEDVPLESIFDKEIEVA